MNGINEVGYGRPPRSTRFQKGRSGNPRGRPRNRKSGLPYDAVLGQMVTIREDGRERRVTAAEAFLLHLTKKGLEGDSASIRACLNAIETARSKRPDLSVGQVTEICRVMVQPGSVATTVTRLRMGTKANKASPSCLLLLAPWLVQAALARLGRELSADEQKSVMLSTRRSDRVDWPAWWSVTA